MNPALLLLSTEALDEVLAGMGIAFVEKALDPLDPNDFLTIVAELKKALIGLTGPAEAGALAKALSILDVDWAALPADQGKKIQQAAKEALAKPPVPWPKVQARFAVEGERVVNGVKTKVFEEYGLDLAVKLSEVDKRIIDKAAKAQGFYIKDQYGKRADAHDKLATDIIKKGIEKGSGREEIGKQLKAALSAQSVERSDSYWSLVAAAHVNRSRAYASLAGYDEAGFDEYEFVAVRDQVTSVQCRLLHGKRFSIKASLSRYGAVTDDPESVKTAMPWMQTGKDDDGNEIVYFKDASGARQTVAVVKENAVGQKDKSGSFETKMSNQAMAEAGIAMPPCHGHCRSRLKAVTDIAIRQPGPRPAAPAAAAPAPTPSGPSKPAPAATSPKKPPAKEDKNYGMDRLEGLVADRGLTEVKPFTAGIQPNRTVPFPFDPGLVRAAPAEAQWLKSGSIHVPPEPVSVERLRAAIEAQLSKNPPKPRVVLGEDGKHYSNDSDIILAQRLMLKPKARVLLVNEKDIPKGANEPVLVKPADPKEPGFKVPPKPKPKAPEPPTTTGPAPLNPSGLPLPTVPTKAQLTAAEKKLAKLQTKDDPKLTTLSDSGMSWGSYPAGNPVVSKHGFGPMMDAALAMKETTVINVQDIVGTVGKLATGDCQKALAKAGSGEGEPIVVYKIGAKYHVFAGHPQALSATLLKQETVAVKVLDLTSLSKPVYKPLPAPPPAVAAPKPAPAVTPPKPAAPSKPVGEVRGLPPAKNLRIEDLPTVPFPTVGTTPVPGSQMHALSKRGLVKRVLSTRDRSSREAIEDFTDEAYTKIRAIERLTDAEALKQGYSLEEIAKNRRASKDIERAFSGGGLVQCDAYRGIADLGKADVTKLLQMKEITLGGTTSSSWDPKVAHHFSNREWAEEDSEDYSVMYRIRVKNGLPVEAISTKAEEREILLKNGTRYRVTGFSKMSDNYIMMDIEEIEG